MRARTPFLLVAVSTLALTACGGGSGSSSDDSSEASGMDLVQSGTLTVCADVPFPPFAFEKGGEYTGFDMELTEEIAKGMGLKHKIKDVGFEGLQSGAALAANTCDMAAAAMTITEEREKNIDFSDPYYDSLQSLLVAADSGISSIKDLSGKTVAVKQGTTGETYAQENVPKDTEVRAYPSNTELYPSLKSGAVAGVIMDLPSNIQHQAGGKYEIAEKYDTGEQYGFAVQEEGSEAILKNVNKQLAKLKENGTYDKLYSKYFDTK